MFSCFKGLNKDVTGIGRYDIGDENKDSCVWSDEKNRSSSSALLDGHPFFVAHSIILKNWNVETFWFRIKNESML